MSSAKPHRDFAALERRRLQAAECFASGQFRLAEIARRVRVSRQSVTRWYAQWQRRGKTGLRAAGRAGRKPRLSSRQLLRVERALRQGPGAWALPGPRWTLPRVAQLIQQLAGVSYHPGHVSKLLGSLAARAVEAPQRGVRGGPRQGASGGGWLGLKGRLSQSQQR